MSFSGLLKAEMCIWRIAVAEKYALSLIFGSRHLISSKHDSKMETMKPYGGFELHPSSNH